MMEKGNERFLWFWKSFVHEKQLHFMFLHNLITNNNRQPILIVFISCFERGIIMEMGVGNIYVGLERGI